MTPGVPEAVVESLVASDNVDAVIVMGVVGSMSESRRAVRRDRDLAALGRSGHARDRDLPG